MRNDSKIADLILDFIIIPEILVETKKTKNNGRLNTSCLEARIGLAGYIIRKLKKEPKNINQIALGREKAFFLFKITIIKLTAIKKYVK
jgi:hypothetical protein